MECNIPFIVAAKPAETVPENNVIALDSEELVEVEETTTANTVALDDPSMTLAEKTKFVFPWPMKVVIWGQGNSRKVALTCRLKAGEVFQVVTNGNDVPDNLRNMTVHATVLVEGEVTSLARNKKGSLAVDHRGVELAAINP